MSKIDFIAATGQEAAAVRVEGRLERARLAIEERAYYLAQERDNGGSGDAGNWFDAERQLFQVPACELIEQNGHLRVRAAAPAIGARQLRLTVLPSAIVIESDASSDTAAAGQRRVRFSEFNRNAILRRVDLPAEIDLASVKATLERGILEVVAVEQNAVVTPPKPKKTERKTPGSNSPRKAKAAAAVAKSARDAKPAATKSAGARPKTKRVKKKKAKQRITSAGEPGP